MIPRFKKKKKDQEIDKNLNREEFLEEHNKLSPKDLRATISMLSRFRIEKKSLFRGDKWSIEKLRRPFILWLTSPRLKEKEEKEKKSV